MKRTIDPIHAAVGLGVFVTALTVYLATMAPTLSFWDCGEFIAVSATLGIPHPPGTPLYVIIGRLFAMVPLFADISARINFLSVLSSSFTALFGYLIGVRLLRSWFAADDSSLVTRLLLYGGAAAGALFLAFGRTHWGNSLEAEVYGLAMLIFAVIIWLTLVYHQMPDGPDAERIMLLAVFLAFLGIGVHMATFLALPICAIAFILKKHAPTWVWFTTAVLFVFELYLVFALSSRPHEIPYYVPVAVVFVVFLFYIFSLANAHKLLLALGGGLALSLLPLWQYAATAVSGNAHTTPVMIYAGGVAMMLTAAFAIFLLMRWNATRKSRQPLDQSVMIGSLFILVAGIMALIVLSGMRGYGPFGFLSVLLAIGFFALIARYVRWPILIALGGVSAVMIGIMPFVYGTIATLVISLGATALLRQTAWRLAVLIVLVSVVGFSVHGFLPVRSAQHPMMNQSNPSRSFDQTINFLERKQYGSMSMTERMFTRRAAWENQFGNYRRMGFWRFFSEQYGFRGPMFMIALVMGLFGMWEAIRRQPAPGLLFTLLILLSSVGLILYMNFADGTRQNPVTGQDYMEVRDRDYFYTPAFVLFGLAIGIGLAATIEFIRESIPSLPTRLRQGIVMVACLALLLPVVALAGNYFEADRSNNYIAHDYGWNLLSSADPNAVFVTYGDNDTFPLWALQEAYGFRKDVKVVNLSLSNTTWYIQQIRDYMGLRLGWNDAQIEALRPMALRDGRVLDLDDQVMTAIIRNEYGRLPVNFSVTVPADKRKIEGRSVDQRLEFAAMMWRYQPRLNQMSVSLDECLSFYTDTTRFKLRGLGDSTVYKDDNMLRLTGNYTSGILIVADSLRKAKRYTDSERLIARMVDQLPGSQELVNFQAQLFAEQAKVAELANLEARPGAGDPKWIKLSLARAKILTGSAAEAEALLMQILAENPNYRLAFEELVRLYTLTKNVQSLRTLLGMWLAGNPNDAESRKVANEIDRQIRELSLDAKDTQ